MYLEWAYQLYNVVFTALPILLFAVIDRDYTDSYLASHPQLYQITQNGSLFNGKIFFLWICDSLFESCILAIIPLFSYNITSPDSSGQTSGIWSYGVAAYTSIVFAANLRLAFITVSS